MDARNVLIAALLVMGLSAEFVWAHGEDKPGPHQGFVRMPGAFHTEVVPEPSSRSLRVYLLDMKWAEPTTKNSKVEIWHREGRKRKALTCEAKDNHFVCQLPEGVELSRGRLELNAGRDGQKGNQVVYDLPLRLQKAGGER